MAEHSWCRDIPRDEAVRAAEDGRSGPLPTLEEAIERQKHAAMTAGVKEGFVKADGEWKRLTDDELRQLLMIPKSVSASSAVEQENKGDSMADRAEIYRAGQFTPQEARQEPNCTERENGLRTERVTLEVTHDGTWGHPSSWPWFNSSFLAWVRSRRGELVRVVEEAHFDDLAQVAMERDAAIRERDKLRGEITSVLDRSEFASTELTRLRNRVASLESQLESVACRAATAETALESAAKLAPAANAAAVSNPQPISGAGKSAGEETQVSEPIDLDDLQRVGVLVREKTDDNWLADMVELACDEIARLRKERLTADERSALELSLELEWPKTSEQWKALAACLGPVCLAPANRHKVAIRGLLDRQPLPPGPEANG